MQSILKKQKCAKILVGDPHQQLYKFRGAVNAMDALAADETAHLTQVGCLILYIKNKLDPGTMFGYTHNMYLFKQSFRFGPTIGYIASCVLTLKEEKRTEIVIGCIRNKGMIGLSRFHPVGVACPLQT